MSLKYTQLRNDERLKSTIVFMLTASDKEQDVTEAKRLGISSYIKKTLNFLKGCYEVVKLN